MSSQPTPHRPESRLRRATHLAAERLRRARRAVVRPRAPKAAEPDRKPSKKALYWTGGIAALLVLAIAILIAIWDWNWFKGPVERAASARLHRPVTIVGDLQVRPWSWSPTATLNGVRVADPPWAGQGRTAEIERLTVQVKILPLLRGRVDLPMVLVDRPNVRLFRDAQGRATWSFSDGRTKGAPLKLPPIRRFIIEDGRLTIDDRKRGLTFTGTIRASEKLGAANRGFRLEGQGALNRAPFVMRVTGGPLLNIERDKPYPFDAVLTAGATHITARGAVPKPFDLGRFYMNTTARGPDLADLYSLTGVALPNTPPYNLSGRLSRDGHLYTIEGLGGRVGDSDLSGQLSVDGSDDRPFLKATLRSKSLDFDDMAAVFGGAPKAGRGETLSAEQAAIGQRMAAQQRLLPDATLKVDRIRAMDADVRYHAASIHDAPAALRSADVRVKLNDGVLNADPLELDLARGQIKGTVRLDARKATPVTALDLRMSGARLEQFIPAVGGGEALNGALSGRVRLTGAGNSVHSAASNANGEVMVVVPGGTIREAFAELMGINVVKGLGLLLSKDQSQTPIRCAVAHFQAKDGVLVANRIVFDTGPVLGTGSGQIDLKSERMAFRLEGHPKELRLIRLMAPITVNGPIKRPKLGVDASEVIAQGGIAAALGALVSPLAAILPFVDPGLAKDANCGALIAEAGRQGAPVKVVGR